MRSVCEFFLKVINHLLESLDTKVLFYSSFCKAENHLIEQKNQSHCVCLLVIEILDFKKLYLALPQSFHF